MRLLKKKLKLVGKKSNLKPLLQDTEERGTLHKKISKSFRVPGSKNPSTPLEKKVMMLKLKNIYKNYGRAICCFILSQAAKNYRAEVETNFNFNWDSFESFIQERKSKLAGINELRALLIIDTRDGEAVKKYKQGFKWLAEIFMKYFSVNWAYHSKLEYKMEYIKCRHELLRRIMNPSLL